MNQEVFSPLHPCPGPRTTRLISEVQSFIFSSLSPTLYRLIHPCGFRSCLSFHLCRVTVHHLLLSTISTIVPELYSRLFFFTQTTTPKPAIMACKSQSHPRPSKPSNNPSLPQHNRRRNNYNPPPSIRHKTHRPLHPHKRQSHANHQPAPPLLHTPPPIRLCRILQNRPQRPQTRLLCHRIHPRLLRRRSTGF